MSRAGKIVLAVSVLFGLIVFGFSTYRVFRSGFWRGPDATFGDQHLKTSVALIELHRVRYRA